MVTFAALLVVICGGALFTLMVVELLVVSRLVLSSTVTVTLYPFGVDAGLLSRYLWLAEGKVWTPAPRLITVLGAPSPQTIVILWVLSGSVNEPETVAVSFSVIALGADSNRLPGFVSTM